jgi:transposase InsO family protein
VIRYERKRPGELIHTDVRTLGRIEGVGHRITGWHAGYHTRTRSIGHEHLHVAIDDASRLGTGRAGDDRQWLGLPFQTLRHSFATGPGPPHPHPAYTPRTNGKAERFIQTSLREWAYVRPYASSAERTQATTEWADTYNRYRPHAGIGGISP